MPNAFECQTAIGSRRPIWALRTAGTVALGKPSAAKRKGRRWDNRHHVTWCNDAQHPNGRDYFDRYRDKGDLPQIPRPSVRPVWTLECPNVEEDKHTYRVFNPATASFKEVIWMIDEKGKTLGGEDGVPHRTRTPRSSSDLKIQRSRETEWDKGHGVVYSRNNNKLQTNYRSYFDRWKDGDGPDTREPTWKLGVEKRVFLKNASEPSLRDRDLLRKERNWKGRLQHKISQVGGIITVE